MASENENELTTNRRRFMSGLAVGTVGGGLSIRDDGTLVVSQHSERPPTDQRSFWIEGINTRNDPMDVRDWRWGLTAGTGLDEVPPDFEPLVIQKLADEFTPNLMETLAKGIQRPKAVLTVGRQSVTIIEIEMEEVTVVELVENSEFSDSLLPLEEFALDFEEVTVTFNEIDASGKIVRTNEFTWPSQTP